MVPEPMPPMLLAPEVPVVPELSVELEEPVLPVPLEEDPPLEPDEVGDVELPGAPLPAPASLLRLQALKPATLTSKAVTARGRQMDVFMRCP